MPAFLDCGGDCCALIKSRDWSDSLGPVKAWPQSLKAATGLLLRSPVPMVMLWGAEGIMLYNDAYSVFAGGRHPELLGSRVREGWPEVADFNDHVMKVGLSGGTLSFRDQELTLHRHGRPERVVMNLDYSPVLGDNGEPAGVLAIVIETTTQRAAERALKANEARMRAVLDGMDEGLLVMSPDLTILDMNAEGERMDGRSRADLIGRHHDEVYETAAPEVRKLYEKVLAEQVPASLEHRYEWPNGSSSTLSLRAFPIEEGIAAFYRDITERVAREAALSESEERFRNIADNTPVMLWVTDETGYCTYLNRTWYDLTGQAPGEGEGLGWLKAVHEEDRPAAERAFLRATEEQVGYETDFRLRRADGSYRWCIDTAAPRYDGHGNFRGYVGSVIDVDERREAVDKVRRSEEQLRALVEQMPIGVAVARLPDGRIDLYNQALETMLGHTMLAGGMDTYDRYGGIDQHGRPLPTASYPLYRAVAFGETVVGEELRYRRPDGRIVTLLGHAAPIVSDDGVAEWAVVTLQDISARKQAEAHQRLLINELSHRAKNLLAIIQSIAQQSFRGDPAAADSLQRFEGRLGALSAAHGILTQQRWEAVPLRRLICDTFLAVRSGDERLKMSGPDILLAPKVAVSLAMAIHELATNALKYGSLSVEQGLVEIEWRAEEGRLRLCWKERNGPLVTEPSRRGFGSRMIERGLAAELGGTVVIRFEPDGVLCEVDAPMPHHG